MTVTIEDKTIENFLQKQCKKNNTSTSEYLSSLILSEIEFLKIKGDIKDLKSQITKLNKGEIKPKSARLLLNEL